MMEHISNYLVNKKCKTNQKMFYTTTILMKHVVYIIYHRILSCPKLILLLF